ncbi:MAG TPA: methyltransferase domain-containing protein [Tepidisphaeraceae bacterium]
MQVQAGAVSPGVGAQSKWPKTFPPLTSEQKRISDDFMRYWHEVLPKRFGLIEKFNHGYSVRHAPANFHRTLEIGAGLGEHLDYEKLTPEQERDYYAVELRQNMTDALQARFPRIKAVTGDCQQRLDFPDAHFDRILAVHVLEHLPDLPAAIREMYRLCDKSTGVFSVVIPCEGSLAYTLARRISAQRIFEKRYNQSYRWFIEREHINLPHEILAELRPYFTIEQRSFFPIPLPIVAGNLVIGLTLRPRPQPLE